MGAVLDVQTGGGEVFAEVLGRAGPPAVAAATESWTVPGFSVDRYRDRLLVMHRHIERHGSFVSHAQRFLIEARRP